MDETELAALVAAARGGIPERYAHVVSLAVSPDGRHAVVGFHMNEPPVVEPEIVICSRRDGEWIGGSSSGGPGTGWSSTSTDGEPNLGVAYAWHDAPPGVARAVVALGGVETEVSVEHGYFLFAAWDVPDSAAFPEVRRFVHEDGRVEEVGPGWLYGEEFWERIRRLRAGREGGEGEAATDS